ncbi:MAG: DUF4139 domain-containing protein [Bacteroidota bacterium]
MRLCSLLLVLALLLGVPSTAQPQPVVSEIESVTVYLQGAQVSRVATARIPAGTTVLRFAGLTPHLDPSSVQLRGEGAFTVLGVAHRRDFLEGLTPEEELARLQALRDATQDSLALEQELLTVFDAEEQVLMDNRTMGENEASGVEALRARADFFRERLRTLRRERFAHLQRIEALSERLGRLNQQLNEGRRRTQPQAQSVVEVTVRAEQATSGRFQLSYLTYTAGWQPLYDLRADTYGAPLALTYKANVYQRTEVAWDNVALTLSTGNPMRPGTAPTLTPWFLDADVAPRARRAEAAAEADVEAMGVMTAQAAAAPAVTVTQNVTSVAFEITEPYAIAPDGQETMVVIQESSLPATYEHYAAPKLAPAAFVRALVTEWEAFNLLSGEANVFFEGAFVGTTYLDAQNTADTLQVSLGQDPGLVVERRLRTDFSERNLLRTRQEVTRAYALDVRNTKAVPVTLVLQDQIPLSTDEAIRISADLDRRAELDEATGLVTWRLTVPAGASETVEVAYSVQAPRDRVVVLD